MPLLETWQIQLRYATAALLIIQISLCEKQLQSTQFLN